MSIGQTIKNYTLRDFVKAHALTPGYFFKPKATINYPYEKNPICPRFRGEHVLRPGGRAPTAFFTLTLARKGETLPC